MKINKYILFFICSLGSLKAQQVVTQNSNSGAGSLREAISNATNGQTITFAASLANQTIILSSTINIPAAKNITIDGIGAANISISGNNTVRMFLLQSTSVNPTKLTFKNLTFVHGLTSEFGAAIKAEHQGMLYIENCKFRNNNAGEGGSAIFSAFEGFCVIKNCDFVANVSVSDNNERGSTLMIWGPRASTISGCNFTNNRGINGAAINGLNAGLNISNCNFKGNVTSDAFKDVGNSLDFLRGYGGAIYVDRASNSTINGPQGSIIVKRCKFEDNIGQSDGGAMYLYTDETDNVLVEECSFDNNEAKTLPTGEGGGGGAIEQMNNSKNRGFVVRNCTFSNNKAAVNGGAIRVDWADTDIINCTFFNNRALLTKSDGYSANGGALVCYSMDNSEVNIRNCTFYNNYAGWVGGAIVSKKENTKIKNSIFYENTAGNGGNNWRIQQHTSDNYVDLGNNLQFPNKYTSNFNDFNVSATITIADPKLLTITNNGGFSNTIGLQSNSPAINAGSGCETLDQRGAPRVGVCDIGAFEFGGVAPVSLTGINSELQDFKIKNNWVIYPNPTSGSWSVIYDNFNNDFRQKNMQIFNSQGNLVHSETLSSAISKLDTDLNNGIYIVKIDKEILKLIIQK